MVELIIILLLSVLLNCVATFFIVKNFLTIRNLKNEKMKKDELQIGKSGFFQEQIYANFVTQGVIVEFVISGISKNKIKIRVTDVTCKEGNIGDDKRKNLISRLNGSWIDSKDAQLCEVNNRDYKLNQLVN